MNVLTSIVTVLIYGILDTSLHFPGDNNEVDDIGLYEEGQIWLHRHHIMGRAVG